MNVLLANMPIRFNAKENLEPPLGICYIASVLKEDGNQVYLKDYEVEEFDLEQLHVLLKKNGGKLTRKRPKKKVLMHITKERPNNRKLSL